MSKNEMTKDELIELAMGFFECFIDRFNYVHLDKPEMLEHDLNNIKGEAIRSYDFIKHYKEIAV